MFLTSKNYLDEVKKLIKDSEELSLAVAFWGHGAEKLLEGKVNTKIICNLKMGGTNPAVIKELQNRFGKENVLQHNHLHSKIILGTNRAIVGSANFSVNGLSFEADIGKEGWKEAGILVTEEANLNKIKIHFDELWADSSEITDEDIKTATEFWKNRKSDRFMPPLLELITNNEIEELKDREIYVVYVDGDNTKTHEENIGIVTDKNPKLPNAFLEKIDFYEGWPRLPKESILISYFFESEELCPDGVWMRYPDLDFKDETKDERPISLQVVKQYEKFLSPAKQKKLGVKIKPKLQKLYKHKNYGVIRLYDLLKD